jgi:hypothetical protein
MGQTEVSLSWWVHRSGVASVRGKSTMSKRFRLGTIGIVTTVLGAGISLGGVAVPALAGTPATGTAPGARVAVEDPSGDDTGAPPLRAFCPPPLSVEVRDITETGGVFHFTIDPTAADYTRIAPMIGNVPFDDIIPDGVTASYTIPFDIFQPGSRGLQASVDLYCTDAERAMRGYASFDLLGGGPEYTAAAMATAATSGTTQAAAAAAGAATGGSVDDASGDNAGSVAAAATTAANAAASTIGASGSTSGAGGDSATGAAGASAASAGNAEPETGADVPAGSDPVTGIQPVSGQPDRDPLQADSDTVLAATGTETAVPALFGGLLLAVGGLVLALFGFRRARLSNQQQ